MRGGGLRRRAAGQVAHEAEDEGRDHGVAVHAPSLRRCSPKSTQKLCCFAVRERIVPSIHSPPPVLNLESRHDRPLHTRLRLCVEKPGGDVEREHNGAAVIRTPRKAAELRP